MNRSHRDLLHDVVHHAIGVKLAAELGRPDRLRLELDALIDTAAELENHPSNRNRKELP